MWPFILCIFLITACGGDLSGRPPFEEMTFSPDYTNISMPDSRTWNVTYEYSTDTTFTGVVRHVSLWYDSGAPFMSHDVLVTTGDFASQEYQPAAHRPTQCRDIWAVDADQQMESCDDQRAGNIKDRSFWQRWKLSRFHDGYGLQYYFGQICDHQRWGNTHSLIQE